MPIGWSLLSSARFTVGMASLVPFVWGHSFALPKRASAAFLNA